MKLGRKQGAQETAGKSSGNNIEKTERTREMEPKKKKRKSAFMKWDRQRRRRFLSLFR